MRRRVVIAATLVAAVLGGAGAALASTSVHSTNVCIVTSSDPNHQHNQYYCVLLP